MCNELVSNKTIGFNTLIMNHESSNTVFLGSLKKLGWSFYFYLLFKFIVGIFYKEKIHIMRSYF